MYSSQEWWSNTETGAGPDPGDPIDQSLRFRGTNSARLFGNFSSTEWTISSWVKIDGDSSGSKGAQYVWSSGVAGVSFNGETTNTFRLTWYDGATFQYSSPKLFTDPNGWYHIVTNKDAIYVNGEFVMSINGINLASTSNQFNIGAYYLPSNYLYGYQAEFHAIDGQKLGPEAFGRYNEQGVWVPVELDWPRNNYSDFLTATNGVNNPQNAFDGSTSTEADADVGAGSNTLNWTPSTAIDWTTSVEVFTTSGNVGDNSQEIRINGNLTGTCGANAWTEVASGGGTIDTFSITNTVGTGRLSGIRVDGVILTDPFLWSADLYTSPSSDTIPVNPTDQDFNTDGTGYDQSDAFNGDNSTGALSDAGSGSWIQFRPAVSITANESLVIRLSNTETIAVNGIDTGLDQQSASLEDVDLSSSLSFPFDIENISIRGRDLNNPRLCTLIVDGQELTNGINKSYGEYGFHFDFEDPNDLGADRSGNGNDFTTTGFDVDPSVNYTSLVDWPATNGSPPNYPRNIFNGSEGEGTEADQCYFETSGAVSIDLLGLLGPISDPITSVSAYVYAGLNGPGIDLELNGNTSNVAAANAWQTVTVNHDGSPVTSFSISTDNPGQLGIISFRVNGTMLVNSINPDYDLMLDSPTQNYCTINRLRVWKEGNPTISDANLKVGSSTAVDKISVQGTLSAQSGKWYYEVTNQDGSTININAGWASTSYTGLFNTDESGVYTHAVPQDKTMMVALDLDNGFMWFGQNGVWDSGATLAEIESGDGTNSFHNGVTGDLSPCFIDQATSYSGFGYFNFGQQPFAYTPPAGFEALQTQNLPASISDAKEHFQAITGAGQGADSGTAGSGNWVDYLTTSDPNGFNASFPAANGFDGNENTYVEPNTFYQGISFRPPTPIPFTTSLRIKYCGYPSSSYTLNDQPYAGNQASSCIWDDVATGPGELVEFTMNPNGPLSDIGGAGGNYIYAIEIDGVILTDFSILAKAQQTFPNGLYLIKDRTADSTQWQWVNSDAGTSKTITMPTPAGSQSYAPPANTSMAYCWNAGEGLLNEEAGFQLIKHTGTLSGSGSEVIPHDLGEKPAFILPLNLDASAGYEFGCWHTGVNEGQSGVQKFMYFGRNGSGGTSNGFFPQPPDENGFSLGWDTNVNKLGNEYYYAVWKEVPGYSKFGQYVGHSNSVDASSLDGPFIYCGFRPAVVITKCSSASSDWIVMDSTRDQFNSVKSILYTNQNLKEAQLIGGGVDFCANGFKIRQGGSYIADAGQTYIYMAFAENPTQLPTTAR